MRMRHDLVTGRRLQSHCKRTGLSGIAIQDRHFAAGRQSGRRVAPFQIGRFQDSMLGSGSARGRLFVFIFLSRYQQRCGKANDARCNNDLFHDANLQLVVRSLYDFASSKFQVNRTHRSKR